MYSIKKSFANCSACKLLDCPSCILETNCKDDITKVDIIFVAENPGKNEVKEERPLVGKAGQLFRKYFEKYGLNKMNYLLTNCVLCQTLNPDGTTGNPEQDVIDLCKINCINIIKICKPKMLVLMGASPMSAFGFGNSGITKLHGKIVEWEGIKTTILVHPSFVNRNLKVWDPKFEEVFIEISRLMGKKVEDIHKTESHKVLNKGIFRYQIPEHFYTDDYRLIDVQFLNKKQKVLYIFRDKNNNKIVHEMNDDYVCYQVQDGIKPKKIVPYDQLNQIVIKYKDRYDLDPDITYEGDVRITAKHAMDYYHFNKGEPKRKFSNIMFMDIEVDTGNDKVFPTAEEANYPINMITTIFNGVKTLYVIDNKTEPIQKIEGCNFKIFNDETNLLKTFINDFKKFDPDYVSGWNLVSYDLQYIYNRLPKLNIKQESISKFSEFYVDSSKYVCHIPGCVAIDQDFLYRMFTFTKMENYKLGFIAQHELGVTKVQLPLAFNEMYWKMLNKTIEYNIRDTELLEQLDDKLAHINLLNELRIICNTSFDCVSSFGQIDSLMVSYLKQKGFSSKNSDPHITKEKYPGAYVYEPIPGTYDWITDFDFASLYPSIMITYNIGVNTFVMKTKDPHYGYEIAYTPEKLPETIDIILDPMGDKKEVKVKSVDLLKKMKDDNLICTINGCFFLSHKKEFSVFGEVVDMLMTSRKGYKKQMFQAIENKLKDEEMFYYTRQLVYKVLANTLYGVVAQQAFRFYDTSLAAAITTSGQEALKTSIIEGNSFMKHLDTNKPYVQPPILSKGEMFADSKSKLYLLPDRSHEYIVTGDTDSIFCCFGAFNQTKHTLTVEKIHEWCSQIESFLNDDKILKVVQRHNADLEYNRLKLKNELVISRGLFLAKKRYAIRVINNEGKNVDKINYMGVEIKRSDYPSKSKEFLSELLDLVLKSEKLSISKIMEFIKRKEREFVKAISNGDKSIARPISYGKDLDDYKIVPQGVKAMEAWNKIVYPIHRHGSKGYMYRVYGIDFDKIKDEEEKKRLLFNYDKFIQDGNKLEVVAIPDEEERLPNYFIPDLKSALQFTFTDRYELMLKPLISSRFNVDLLTI